MPIPEIIDGQITNIGGKESRPVYFLTVAPSAAVNIVVKGEHGGDSRVEAAASVAWSSQIMGAVNDSQVNSVPMSAREVDAFKKAARAKFPAGDKRLYALDNTVLVWVKMPYVAGLSDADPTIEKGRFHEADFKNARDAITKLHKPLVWRELGRVVAVDLFNGNNDRFSDEGKWVNQGNIMFAGGRVIGLDTYDPNSESGRLTTTGNRPAGLDILKDMGKRRAFAEKCVRSVGEVLHENLEKTLKGLDHFGVNLENSDGGSAMEVMELALVPDLFKQFVHFFYEGIGAGTQELKAKLIAMVGPSLASSAAAAAAAATTRPAGLTRTAGVPNLAAMAARPTLSRQSAQTDLIGAAVSRVPPGVIERMKYLGWI